MSVNCPFSRITCYLSYWRVLILTCGVKDQKRWPRNLNTPLNMNCGKVIYHTVNSITPKSYLGFLKNIKIIGEFQLKSCLDIALLVLYLSKKPKVLLLFSVVAMPITSLAVLNLVVVSVFPWIPC